MEQDWLRWRNQMDRYFCSRVPEDPHTVEDLVQETCLRAWASYRDGRVERLALRWLVGIGWRVLADHRRRSCGRWPQGRKVVERLRDVAAEPRTRKIHIAGRERPLSHVLLLLDRCIAELPAPSGPLLRDRLHGHTMRELARLHGVSENVVKLRLYRGRRRLERAIMLRLQEEERCLESV